MSKRKVSLGLIVVLVMNLLMSMGALAAEGDNTSFVTVTMTSPDSTQDVDPAKDSSQKIILTFSEMVTGDVSKIEVKKHAAYNPQPVQTVVTNLTTQYTGKDESAAGFTELTLDLGTLDYKTIYSIYIPDIQFKSVKDSNKILKTGGLPLTFETTYSAESPKLVTTGGLSPANNATVIGSKQTLAVSFNKPVTRVKESGATNHILVFGPNEKQYTVLNERYDPASYDMKYMWDVERLVPGDYYVRIGARTFVDGIGQLYGGITDGTTWRFTVTGNTIGWAGAPTSNAQINTPLTLSFNTEMYANAGVIQIYENSTAGTAVMDIPVEDSRYVNQTAGSKQVQIKLPSSLQYSKTYVVKVPEGAFVDKEGKTFSQGKQWSFTTGTQISTALAIESLNPSRGSTSVALTTRPTITFNRNISVVKPSDITLYREDLYTKALTSVSRGIEVSGRNLIINPTSNLVDNSRYYIEITPDAIVDAVTGSRFGGILGMNYSDSWNFQTSSNDKTPPVLQDATMYTNNTMRLRYNEALYSVGNLSTSAFTVSVNGENRRISNAYVSGEYVYITLDLGVAVGQVIRVSYSANSTWGRIQDLASNPAAGFSNREVTNGVDSVLPKPKDGYVSGSTLYLTFSESLKGLSSSYAYEQFTVTANGSTKSIKSISSYNGSTGVTLTLDSSVGNGEVIKVSYQPGSYPLQDFRGNNIAPFTDFFVRNYNDSIPPEFTGVSGSGNKIVLTYNEPLRTSPLPLKSQFSVLVNNAAVYVNAVEVVSNQVILTLASSFTQEQAVTLSYVSGYGGTADLNGNLAGFINLQPVTYSNVAQGIQSATVSGDTITITYNSTLRAVSFLPPNQFSVLVNNAQVGVQSASISGNRVTLKLSSQIVANQSVTLSYMTGSTPLYSATGEKLNTFSGMTVQHTSNTGNNNTGANGQPSYVSVMSSSTFNKIGYVLNVSTAKLSTSQSYRGVSTNRYTIDTMQMQNAFKFLTTLAANRMLVFEVPPSERAAEVAIPLSALSTVIGGTQTYSIAVKYKESLYEIPLEGISLSEITRALNVSTLNSVYLIIQLESVQRSQLNMPTVINGVSVSTLMEPVEIRVVAVNGNGSTNSGISVGHAGNYYLRMSGSRVTTTQTTLVNYNLTLNIMERMLASVAGGNGNLLFVAKINGNSIIGPVMGSVFYPDINNHWGKGDINELTSKLIVSPRSASTPVFEPNRNITRGEFGEYIAKALGLTSKTTARSFPDVPANTRGGYIASAVDAGIITGYPDGTFKPEQPITREQMALMMVRAMSYAKQNVTLNGTAAQTLSRFKDAGKIQDKDTVAKAVQSGIIQGMSATSFQPKGNATRAQAVAMIKRVLSKLNYL
jgi:uncharacterized repeat protein (TIGR02059 family)